RFVRRTPPSLHTYMIATEPLDDATQERFGFRENSLGDTSLKTMAYMRIYGNRLLFGGGDKLFSKANTAADQNAGSYRKLHAGMLRSFPFLDSTRIEAAWGGPLHEPLNTTPVVRLAAESPNVVLSVGYGSSGVALTQFSGKMVTGLVLGKPHVDPDAERLRQMYETLRIPVREVMKLGIRSLWFSMFSK
ncbi:MAG: FAD-binding oxidoreductase, partial [Spirochaetota bacterium]